MTKINRIDKQGYWLTLAIIGSLFLGSGSIGVSFGGFFLFPLRILCVFAIPFSVYAVIRSNRYIDVKLFLILIVIYAITVGLLINNSVYSEQVSVLQIGVTITIMLIGYINNTNRLTAFFSLWIIGALIVNCISCFEILTGNYILNELERGENFYQGMGFNRPIAIYNNSNNLAFFNAISAIFILTIIVSPSSFSKRTLFFAKVAFFLTLISILFSFSRAAILSFTFVCVYYLLFDAYYRKSLVGILRTSILSIISTVLLFTAFPKMYQSVLNVYDQFVEKTISSGERSGDETRFSFVEMSVSKLLSNNGFGGGPGFSWNDYHNDKGMVGPHNFFLEIMVDYGIWAFAYALFLLFKIRKEFLKDKSVQKNKIVMSGSIIAFFLLTLSIGSTIGAPAFWSWFGIINIMRYIDI